MDFPVFSISLDPLCLSLTCFMKSESNLPTHCLFLTNAKSARALTFDPYLIKTIANHSLAPNLPVGRWQRTGHYLGKWGPFFPRPWDLPCFGEWPIFWANPIMSWLVTPRPSKYRTVLGWILGDGDKMDFLAVWIIYLCRAWILRRLMIEMKQRCWCRIWCCPIGLWYPIRCKDAFAELRR